MSSHSFIVHTADLSDKEFSHRKHPLDNTRERYQLPIGDKTGLTKTGVHFCRLPAHNISTTLHWHTHEDEWFFIIEAEDDAALLLREGDEAETKEVKITQGDFLGFPAALKNAHALKSGAKDLVYLVGGSREALDVSNYPELGRRRVIDGTGGSSWIVDDRDVRLVQH